MKYKGWIIGGSIAMGFFVIGGYGSSILREELGLRTQIMATQVSNEVVFDRVWKTISQQVQISSKYKDSFKEIYIGIMQARNREGEAKLAKFIHEANSNLDSSIDIKIMNTIEGSRLDFQREQQKLIDQKREYDTLVSPQNVMKGTILHYVFGKNPINIQIVTSENTKDAFKTGEENDVKLFDKN